LAGTAGDVSEVPMLAMAAWLVPALVDEAAPVEEVADAASAFEGAVAPYELVLTPVWSFARLFARLVWFGF
jgi:hypothetical protein